MLQPTLGMLGAMPTLAVGMRALQHGDASVAMAPTPRSAGCNSGEIVFSGAGRSADLSVIDLPGGRD